jgi:hypothetical protein
MVTMAKFDVVPKKERFSGDSVLFFDGKTVAAPWIHSLTVAG